MRLISWKIPFANQTITQKCGASTAQGEHHRMCMCGNNSISLNIHISPFLSKQIRIVSEFVCCCFVYIFYIKLDFLSPWSCIFAFVATVFAVVDVDVVVIYEFSTISFAIFSLNATDRKTSQSIRDIIVCMLQTPIKVPHIRTHSTHQQNRLTVIWKKLCFESGKPFFSS